MFRKWLNELSYEIHKAGSRRRSESFYRAGLVIRAIFEKRFIARLLTIPPKFVPAKRRDPATIFDRKRNFKTYFFFFSFSMIQKQHALLFFVLRINVKILLQSAIRRCVCVFASFSLYRVTRIK